MFKNPQGAVNQKNTIIFSEFLTQVDNGRVVQVEIQGKNIKGVMSNGEVFNTYAPDDPNLIQKLSNKGVSISASPIEEKMPSLLGIFIMVSDVITNCCGFSYETNARRKRRGNGFWKI